MKHVVMILAGCISLLCISCSANNPRRQARQMQNEIQIDSMMNAVQYRFVPDRYSQGAGGRLRVARNPAYELKVLGDHGQVYLPFIQGAVPPYRRVDLNTVLLSIDDYRATKTSKGWDVSFNSRLYATQDFTFNLTVDATTGDARLDVKAAFNAPITYYGYLMKVY